MIVADEWMRNIPLRGVAIKPLETHSDSRGFFREIIRTTDAFFNDVGFGQWSHSMMLDGVLKAWHFHRIQTDYFYVPMGIARIGLCDLRKDSSSYLKTMDFKMGEGQPSIVLKVPPGIAHGVMTVKGPVHMMYMMSHIYCPDDEVRIPHDDPGIRFNWYSDISSVQ